MSNKKEIDELEKIKKIVERCNYRRDNNMTLLPKFKNNIKPKNRTDDEKQEDSDANKLSIIRKAYSQYHTGIVKENDRHYSYYQSVIDYLDENISGWNDEKKIEENKDKENLQMKEIIELVKRCNIRKEKGLNLIPKFRTGKKSDLLTEDEKIQGSDADKLHALSNEKTFLYESVKKYLDDNLDNWDKRKNYKINNITVDKKEELLLNDVKMIVERCNKRVLQKLHKYPRSKINKVKKDNESEDEYKIRIDDEKQQARDYDKLSKIKNNNITVFDSIIEYLDQNLPEWK
jgi:hypothetical protein